MGCCHPSRVSDQCLSVEPPPQPAQFLLEERFPYYVKNKMNPKRYDTQVRTIKKSVPRLKPVHGSMLLIKRGLKHPIDPLVVTNLKKTQCSESRESRSMHQEELLEIMA